MSNHVTKPRKMQVNNSNKERNMIIKIVKAIKDT